MTADRPRCQAYDQITDRTCRYYADHGGRHNFARLDHDASLERELRSELDAMTTALGEALDLFDATWCTEHGHSPTREQFEKATKLWQLIQPNFTGESYP